MGLRGMTSTGESVTSDRLLIVDNDERTQRRLVQRSLDLAAMERHTKSIYRKLVMRSRTAAVFEAKPTGLP